MKKLILVFVAGLVLVACNDNNNSPATGGSIDSNYNAPDHTRVEPDTTVIDSNYGATGDTNMRKDNPGTSSGQSGSATGSNNSGSVKDDTKGNK